MLAVGLFAVGYLVVGAVIANAKGSNDPMEMIFWLPEIFCRLFLG